MGKKFKGDSKGNFKAKKPDIPVEDDPYWKVSHVFMDEHRIGRYLERFYQFMQRHPQWADDFMDGIPTYYCVIGVHRGATSEEVSLSYEEKTGHVIYHPVVVGEAIRVISSPSLQKEYDEFLLVMEQFTKCLPPFEKNELIRTHSEYINEAKKIERLARSQLAYGEYWALYIEGMPDLYEVAGLVKEADIETINRECRQDSELLRKISSLLTDPAFREPYDTMLDMIATKMEAMELDSREKKRDRWRLIDQEMAEKIMLMALTDPGFIDGYLNRSRKILNTNQDWKDYLPPSNENFFSILGLEAGFLPLDKKEAENIIRDKYRTLPRTPTVNLAYSVLKNQILREDYLWLLENHKLIGTLERQFSEEKARGPRRKGSAGKRGNPLFG